MTINYTANQSDVAFEIHVVGRIRKTIPVTVRTPDADGYEYTEADVLRIAEEQFKNDLCDIEDIADVEVMFSRIYKKREGV